jgi:hypothetical protein
MCIHGGTTHAAQCTKLAAASTAVIAAGAEEAANACPRLKND